MGGWLSSLARTDEPGGQVATAYRLQSVRRRAFWAGRFAQGADGAIAFAASPWPADRNGPLTELPSPRSHPRVSNALSVSALRSTKSSDTTSKTTAAASARRKRSVGAVGTKTTSGYSSVRNRELYQSDLRRVLSPEANRGISRCSKRIAPHLRAAACERARTAGEPCRHDVQRGGPRWKEDHDPAPARADDGWRGPAADVSDDGGDRPVRSSRHGADARRRRDAAVRAELRAAGPEMTSRGTSKSAVSRRFVARTTAQLAAPRASWRR